MKPENLIVNLERQPLYFSSRLRQSKRAMVSLCERANAKNEHVIEQLIPIQKW